MPAEQTPPEPEPAAAALSPLAREVEEFVASSGWGQPAQLFALVSTRALLAEQPALAGTLDPASPYTPVAQEALPAGDLADALGTIEWPDTVSGCALAQEIVVLPPDAESELEATVADAERMQEVAAGHPDRREARLVAAVLRDGSCACVLRLREPGHPAEDTGEAAPDRVEHPELAPNLTSALLATLND